MNNESDKIIIDWSMGEAMTTPILENRNTILLSTGFLQNKNCDRCLYQTLDSFLLTLKIGPNPVEQNLQLHLKQAGVNWVGYDLYNTDGLVLYREKISSAGLSLLYHIPFNAYPKGWYILKCYFLVDGKYPVFKIFQIYKL